MPGHKNKERETDTLNMPGHKNKERETDSGNMPGHKNKNKSIERETDSVTVKRRDNGVKFEL